MSKIKILKVCATERATFFAGDVVSVPDQADEKLAEAWIEAGIAEAVKEKAAEGEAKVCESKTEGSEGKAKKAAVSGKG